jgi:hypothetical protein
MADLQKSPSWWSTVPGILTAIAGVLTAVTGLILAIHQIWPHSNGSQQPHGCKALAGMSLDLTTREGAHGVIGPSGIVLWRNPNGAIEFRTTANFTGEPVDHVEGTCWGDSISFVRSRPGVFIQYYKGRLFPKVDGVLGDNAQIGTTTWHGSLFQP